MKKFIIITLSVLLVIALSCLGGYILNDKVNSHDPVAEDLKDDNIYKPGMVNISKETDISEILVKGVQRECRLITTEIYLNCDITINSSLYAPWGEYSADMFKKRQKLTFYASALFSIDLEEFSADDISFSEHEKRASIYIEPPRLAYIAVDNEKTVINKTEKGFFRFGEIKITPENYNEIENEAIKRMTEQVDTDEVKILSEYNAKIAVEELFMTILSATPYADYEITLEFK